MALATHATGATARPHLAPPEVWIRLARRWVAPLASIVVCAAGLNVLVPPAMRAADVPVGGSVSVQVLGRLSTAGLPRSAPVSQLTVRNDGPSALSWSARTSVAGPGAAAVVIETWLPSSAGCGEPTRLLTASDWSAAALSPGQSARLCARVRTTGEVSGEATPTVSVEARPA